MDRRFRPSLIHLSHRCITVARLTTGIHTRLVPLPTSIDPIMKTFYLSALATVTMVTTNAFSPVIVSQNSRLSSKLFADVKAAPVVTGEELELMLTEWDQPLVVDAYATWCGPCVQMAPEFEAAAEELRGKVRFVKMDTDKEEAMATRLNIMGLPTLLFLDKYESEDESGEKKAAAVLKARIEGALKKEMITDLCQHHFFGAPRPEGL